MKLYNNWLFSSLSLLFESLLFPFLRSRKLLKHMIYLEHLSSNEMCYMAFSCLPSGTLNLHLALHLSRALRMYRICLPVYMIYISLTHSALNWAIENFVHFVFLRHSSSSFSFFYALTNASTVHKIELFSKLISVLFLFDAH